MRVSTSELPATWRQVRLGEIVEFAPRPPTELFPGNSPVSLVPMAAVSEVSGKIDLTQSVMPSEGKRRNLTYFADGDVIFAKITPCMENGKVARAVNLLNGHAFGSTEFHVLRPGPSLDGRYLQYLLVHEDFRHEAARSMTGAVGQRRVPRSFLEDCLVDLPPKDEQIEVAELLGLHLSRLSVATASVTKVVATAERLRQSILNAFTQPANGTPTTLGAVAKWSSGGTPKTGVSEFYGGSIPWAVIGDLTEGLVVDTAQSITEEGLAGSSAKVVDPGTVMLAMYGASIGRTGIAGRPLATNQAIACAKVDEQIVRQKYLLRFLQGQKAAFVRAGQGGAQPNISQTIIKAWPIAVPPVEDQDRLVEVAEDHLARLGVAMAAATQAERLAVGTRRSLMHAAFTGRLTTTWREMHNG